MRTWTDSEIEILKRDYPKVEAKIIASTLNKGYFSVLNKAWALGLKKDKSFFTVMGERLKESGKSHRFKKGQIPINKGKKQIEFMNSEAIERTKATRFKTGNLPHNTKPDGYITIRKDKRGILYKWIKKEGKMQPYHLWVWKINRNEIQKGFNVVFKDSNTLNCVIDNLECISNEENMKRNTIHKYPTELKSEIRKVSKLKKVINKIEQSKI